MKSKIKKLLSFTPLYILLFTLMIGFVDLPSEVQNQILPNHLEEVKKLKIKLGLDLQGGTQLDYKIDLRKVPELEQHSIIEGVLEVIEKRVNSLGVAEPNIFVSKIADETHIIVELAGIKDIEQAKASVGKTIQLEFKVENNNISENKKAEYEKQASDLYNKSLNIKDFRLFGEEEQLANPGRVSFSERDFQAIEAYDDEMKNAISKTDSGQIVKGLLPVQNEYSFTNGKLEVLEGKSIVRVVEKKDAEQIKTTNKKVETSHILISYQGADRAEESITRTKEEAKEEANKILEKLNKNSELNFGELAAENSNEPGADKTLGKLSTPVEKGGAYVKEFTDAALSLEENQISKVIETGFGYHLIKADKVTPSKVETYTEEQAKIERIFISTSPNPWKSTTLTGEHFTKANVDLSNGISPSVAISFNKEGAKLFEELTENNIGKQIAIFVGGQLISAPKVNAAISGGQAQITGQFTMEEAQNLARDLNTGAIPAPIILTGQFTIGSTLGEAALNSSMHAAMIGLILLGIYMILYYRLPGLLANFALITYGAILIFLIKVTLPVVWTILISLTIFGLLLKEIVNSDEGGWEKFISIVLASIVLFFIMNVLSTGIVLTLAGIAGIILSIGMAVDANILIFERVQEEVRLGHNIQDAVKIGFKRAWTSIRDSNFSSLITCAILFSFGSSIIKGFAFNLALGILISMFTAITITRSLLNWTTTTSLAKDIWAYGPNMHKEPIKAVNFLKYNKVFYTISSILVIASILVWAKFGLNLGIDFKGGTLMDLQFKNSTTNEQITESINNYIEENTVTETNNEVSVTEIKETNLEETLTINSQFSNYKLLSSGENQYIIKTKTLDDTLHADFLNYLRSKHGELEETRFTTVGPTIGANLKQKAVKALIFTLVLIVLYIAFAFRKLPNKLNAWKFGICAIVALVHDVLITLGIFILLGHYAGVELDSLFITALLTIMGFSVHDTIVVFDRLRENSKNHGLGMSLRKLTNLSLTETFARSVNTSISTLFTIVALYLWGDSSIEYFILALIIGTIIGTYSSLFTATPLLITLEEKESK